MGTLGWNLELQVEHATRLAKLRRSVPFQKLAGELSAGMTVLCCHSDSITGTPYARVAYCVQVEKDLFDLFFNSSSGYRASYYRSQGEGMDANAVFLKAVMQKLLKCQPSQSCALGLDFMRESLATPSAKVWLAECGREVDQNCAGCKGEWAVSSIRDDKPEILNGVWERSEHRKAKWGCKAPFLTKLRILGAFLDDRFNERIPYDKRFRAREIHEMGWA